MKGGFIYKLKSLTAPKQKIVTALTKIKTSVRRSTGTGRTKKTSGKGKKKYTKYRKKSKNKRLFFKY